jgi:glutamate synthase domain-containing protein 2
MVLSQKSENQVQNKPISWIEEKLIQERAEGKRELKIFGSQKHIYELGAEFITTSYSRTSPSTTCDKITIGSPQCLKPYDASVLNCSALSFGPMGKNFILACNKAAAKRGFYQNTGEAGISPYHLGVDVDIEAPDFDLTNFFREQQKQPSAELKQAGSIVWQIGSGYYGCRDKLGAFCPELFKLKSSLPNVGMIEIKLSQGLDPCKALPMKKLTKGVAQVLGVNLEERVALPNNHKAFSSPIELLKFLAQLRDLSGGKPVGIKLAIGQRKQFLGICKAILATKILPDFFTIDGMEGGTSGSYKGVAGFVGTPLNESLLFAHNALTGINVRQHIKIIASARVFTEQELISKLALGADLCASARSILIASGCTQQMECNQGSCIRGIATQSPHLLKRFDVDKATEKICNFHRITLTELSEILSLCGLSHPDQVSADLVFKRISVSELKPLSEIYEFLKPGSLKQAFLWSIPSSFRNHWKAANAQSFI